MFEKYLSEFRLEKILCAPEEFHALPKREEREIWENIDPEIAEFYRQRAEAIVGKPIPRLRATQYMEYAENGNRTHFEDVYFGMQENLTALIITECIENKGTYLREILDYVWAFCEEATWVIPAHNNHMTIVRIVDCLPKTVDFDVVDLFGAETASLLSWACYYFEDYFESVSPQIMKTVRWEMQRRIFEPFLKGSPMPWMGYQGHTINNWVPWIVSNCIIPAAMFAKGHDRVLLFQKFLSLLDRFLDQYGPDGGCSEGPGYWNAAGAALFDALEELYSISGGAIDCYQEPLIRNVGEYIMHVHLFGDHFVNFADGAPKLETSGELIHRFGERVGSTPLAAFGLQQFKLCNQKKERWFMHRLLKNVLNYGGMKAAAVPGLTEKQTWLRDLQVCISRDKESGLMLACKGGHNNESHNHNDVGCLVVYKNEQPVLIDPGVETYTYKTFSADRYTIWTMRSPYHNLPTIGGEEQPAGQEFAAHDVACAFSKTDTTFSLGLEKAYPEKAGIRSYERTIRMQYGREGFVELCDTIDSDKPVEYHFTLAERPELREDGAAVAGAYLGWERDFFDARVEEIPLTDPKIIRDWDGRTVLYRLNLTPKGSVDKKAVRFTVK